MSSQAYDIAKFLKSVAEKDYPDIISAADAACAAAERVSYGKRGAPAARAAGSTDYISSLKAFLFFMRTGARPAGVGDTEFRLYRPVCEALVKKEQFKSSVLDLFD